MAHLVTRTFAELTAAELYALLRLRFDVFVVEQRCIYPELDGRDLEKTATHWWLADEPGRPLAYLRVLRDGDVVRIGRVATAKQARGGGLAAELFGAAVQAHAGERIVIEAQSYLAGWYERFGFVAVGDEFDDEGIMHVEMRRDPTR